ncbi:MAG: methyltransferase domain-containing protein, partial [Pseudomonadota bacterium]
QALFQKVILMKSVRAAIIDRLDDTPRQFARILDLGAHTGCLADALSKRPGTDFVAAMDLSEKMAALAGKAGVMAIAADEEALPFAPGSFDLVTSASALHAVNDLPGALIQIRTVLKPDGLFLGALFGAGTLTELRMSLSEAEAELHGGAALRMAPLPGLQDSAGLLQRAGFALPVADIDHIMVRYRSPFHLLGDLGGMAERSSLASQPSRGLSRRILTRMAEIYADRFSDSDGKVRASFEVIYLSGWAPGPGQPVAKRPGSAKARLAEALGTTEISGGDKAG